MTKNTMKTCICLLVAIATVALAFQSAGRLVHVARRSNLQLAKKISFREALRFTAVAGDRDSGGSDGNGTNRTKNLLVQLETVSEPAVVGNIIRWNTGSQPGTNFGGIEPGSQLKPQAVRLANAVHTAHWIPHAMDGLLSILPCDRMTFFNVTGEGEREKLEVCHFPRTLGMFPSFFDSPKQRDAVGTDLIFRRIRPIDQSRFAKTITTLKEGDHAIWCGPPGIGKSTEANFVLLEFLRNLGDGEDSEWPTKVAHRVDGQLFLYTWNAAEGRVECGVLPGETLQDVERFSRFWAHQQMVTKKKPPVLFLELAEREKDPIVSIPTFIALSSRMVKTTLKTIDKSGSCKYLLVRPHEPEEVLLMAKVMFEADPEQLCVRLGCEREWDKVVEVLLDRVGIVGPLVRQVFSRQSAFDEYIKSMDAIATTVGTSHAIARLTKFNIPPALQYFVAPYPLGRGAVDPEKPKKTCAFKFLSDHAASLLANSTMDPEFLIYAAVHGLECTETFLRTVRTAAGR